jgi:hypothetical protein
VSYARVATVALDWLGRNQQRFTDIAAEGNDPLRLKPLCELALAADVLVTFGDEASGPAGREQLARCWRALNDGELFIDVLQRRPDIPMLLLSYPCFVRHGWSSPPLEAAVRRFFSVRGFAADLAGWSRVGFARLLELVGASPPWTVAEALADTFLGQRAEPWSMTRSSAYATTHLVFYLTDNGTRPDGLPGELRAYLADWLPVWLERFHRARNGDLFAEMLMTARFAGLPDEDDHGAALASYLQPDGALRGREGLGSSPRAEGDELTFIENYHTTLVGLSAAVAARGA